MAHPAYWKVKSAVHACGEAKAKAQLAATLAQMADDYFRTKDAELVAAMTAAGLDPKAQYTLEDADETIALKGAP